MTKEQIKQVCDKHLDIISQFVESKHSTDQMKIAALQQQVAIMRLCDDLIHFTPENPGQLEQS